MTNNKQIPRERSLFDEFLQKSSLNGLRILLFYTPYKIGRYVWKIFIAAIIIWTQYVVINLIIEYMGQPTEVRMSTQRVHISETPFPAVSVCSGNKFSRKKLYAYAQEVFEHQQNSRPNYMARTVEEMANHLLLLDGFFIFPYEAMQPDRLIAEKLDNILSSMYNTTQYPIRNILRFLAPDCESIVIRGLAFGDPINVTQFWQKRMTTMGFCCLFNYRRPSNAIDKLTREKDNAFMKESATIQFESNSILSAAQFVLQYDDDDFTIRDFNIDAFHVHIFPSEDYAAIQSSNSGNILVAYNSIVELPVQPEFSFSSHRVRQFPPKLRNCYFEDEGRKLLNTSYYSIDECLMKCRLSSMLKHCGCAAAPMVGTDDNITYCNLLDLICLNQWNAIWYGWVYFDYVNEANPNAMNSQTAGHMCPHCLPSCNGVHFQVFQNPMTLRRSLGNEYVNGILRGLNNSKPLAIIKLFFKQRFAQATILDVVGYWVVHLNRFGGIMGLMYGFSIICFIEVIYFGTGKFFVLYIRKWRVQAYSRITRIATAIGLKSYAEEPQPAFGLYWNELMPKPKFDHNGSRLGPAE